MKPSPEASGAQALFLAMTVTEKANYTASFRAQRRISHGHAVRPTSKPSPEWEGFWPVLDFANHLSPKSNLNNQVVRPMTGKGS
jgi:hypothetical protein